MAKVVGLEAQVRVYMPRSPPFISANKTNDTQVNKGFHKHSCQKCCHENVPSSRKPEMDTLFLNRDDAAFKSHHSHRPIRLAHTTSPSDPNTERERERATLPPLETDAWNQSRKAATSSFWRHTIDQRTRIEDLSANARGVSAPFFQVECAIKTHPHARAHVHTCTRTHTYKHAPPS